MLVSAKDVSVVLCVYTMDRWSDTCDAIASIEEQAEPVGETIVVVDHCPELLARLREQFPSCRVIANEEVQGLSGARNTGVRNTRGRYIAFLDDDAVAPPRWIEAMLAHFVTPHVLGVSTVVAPLWQGERPGWFPDEFLWVVGCSYKSQSAGPVRNLIGASMLISRDLFDKVGGFHQGLGRARGLLPMGGEETEICMRAAEAIPFAAFVLDDSVVVGHKVRAARLTLHYFLLRCIAEGISKAQLTAMPRAQSRLSVERTYVTKSLLSGFFDGISHGCVALDINGFGRSMAILLGFGSTVVAFAYGRLQLAARRGGKGDRGGQAIDSTAGAGSAGDAR
jgi:glucosyl-dolichyl phosphate glucuronosyltransferase